MGESRGLLPFAALFAATLAAASLSWLLLEKPLNGLKDRFPYVVSTSKREPSCGPPSC